MTTKLVIWATVVIVIVLPFYLIRQKISKVKRLIINKIKNVSAEQNGSISDIDYWNKTAIGMDIRLRKVLISKMQNNEIKMQEIDLQEIKNCRQVVIAQNLNNSKVFEKIQLNLTKKQSGEPDEIIVFYNIDTDSLTMVGELQLMEKWEKIINEHLKK